MPTMRLTAKAQKIKKQDLASILLPMDPEAVTIPATKVIFTVGPACQDVNTLVEILRAGATCARIDLTWGPIEFHQKSLRNLQQAMQISRCLCAVMLDTLGREIFVRRQFKIGPDLWPMHDSPMDVVSGQTVTLTTDAKAVASKDVLPVNYSKLPGMAQVGDMFYIGRYLVSGADQASLYLKATNVSATDITCEAQNNASLNGLLTVFHLERSKGEVANAQNDQPLLSEYDTDAIKKLAGEFDIDFLSLSYTRGAEDIFTAREFLKTIKQDSVKVIAKVETRQALLAFRSILSAADGVMLSRGNLGLDCLPEKMATIQKNATLTCNMVGKVCILTRICDTMVNAPRPTRAEATDVANAVLDGVDALLLGAETLRGCNPLITVQTVLACCQAAEAVFDHVHHFDHLMKEALKAEETGIFVPGGSDEMASPESSVHGGAALAPPSYKEPPANVHQSASHANLATQVAAMTHFAQGPSLSNASSAANLRGVFNAAPMLSKLEAVASSAVRAAEKAAAKLIVVFTDTGLTASLVAKYRPNVPILTLVVPRLVNDNMKWKLTGRNVAKQCLLTRGLVPMLATPSPDGGKVLHDAIGAAASMNLVQPYNHVVCVEKVHGDYCIKMVSVDGAGRGILSLEDPHQSAAFGSPTRRRDTIVM